MSDILEKTALSFDQLSVSSGAQIEALFVKLRDAAEQEAKSISNVEDLERFRVKWLGRKSGISTRVRQKWLKPAPPEAKRWVGHYVNWFLGELENIVGYQKHAIEVLKELEPAQGELDLTLPGRTARRGARHLITQTLAEMCEIFTRIGFSVVEGPEVETDYYNFEALNIPAFHPARDDFDTLYMDFPAAYLPAELRGKSDPRGRLLLRTHTSPMQIRVMEKQPPPVRIVVPGKTYRRDNPDASHSFMFHQLEGLCVDRDITFGDLKGTLEYFLREFFGPETRTRFSPSYFPFTEPSADVAATCVFCKGAGCRVCKFTGWIELLGSGMVDPAVYEYVGYNPAEVSGFAFGMGVDRFAMLKYGVDDLQLFFQNDVRFLQQFRR
ncbi:MAG: phenylalanine--tRNA ligase subunit alpha [Terriglobia bacterium]